jgi:phosphoribosylanthranilate isomerase
VDAQAAIAAGSDAIGFNFHRASPRYVSCEHARAIISALPPFVTAVGLFVDSDPALVREQAAAAGVVILQFQGVETDAECAAAGMPYIKAIRMSVSGDAVDLERRYPRASAYQLDGFSPGQAGGAGVPFDWSWWPRSCSRPLILAGGLTATNVARAISLTQPFAVDVCSGVEGVSKGVKDPMKIHQFMTEVQRADRRN